MFAFISFLAPQHLLLAEKYPVSLITKAMASTLYGLATSNSAEGGCNGMVHISVTTRSFHALAHIIQSVLFAVGKWGRDNMLSVNLDSSPNAHRQSLTVSCMMCSLPAPRTKGIMMGLVRAFWVSVSLGRVYTTNRICDSQHP